MTIEITTLPTVTGLESSIVVLALADGAVKALPPNRAGASRTTFKAGGTAFSLSEIQSGSGIYGSKNPGVITWRMPTMVELGYTYSDANRLMIALSNEGTGSLLLNPSVNRGAGNLAAMLAGVGWSQNDTFIRTDVTGSPMFILNNPAAIGTAGSWTGPIAVPNDWLADSVMSTYVSTYTGVQFFDPRGLNINYSNQYDPVVVLEACGIEKWKYS